MTPAPAPGSAPSRAPFPRPPLPAVALLALWLIVAVAAPFAVAPESVDIDLSAAWAGPTAAAPLGFDGLGRDVLARLASAALPALLTAAGGASLTLLLGVGLGLSAGSAGGWIDAAVRLSAEAFMAFPRMVFALTTAAALGGGTTTVVCAFAAMSWPMIALPVRAEVVALRRESFITAARALGASPRRIAFRHTAPALFGGAAARVGVLAAQIVLLEGAMSFLGLGAPEPTPSWGGMIRDGLPMLHRAPHTAVAGATAIFAAALAANLTADWVAAVVDRRPSALAAARRSRGRPGARGPGARENENG